MAGIADLSSLLKQMDILEEFKGTCVPEARVALGQLTDVVIKYLRDHPEERHLHGAVLVITAVSDAFPCPAAD